MAGGKKIYTKNVEFSGVNTASNSRPMYCSDKRLIPRIKEYIKKLEDGCYVDVDDMATSLQFSFPEYSRRKRHAFRNLVGKAYQSLNQSNQLRVQEELLEQMERDHFERRLKEADEEEMNSSVSSCSADEENEEEKALELEISCGLEDPNTMNNSLLRVYKSCDPVGTSDQTDQSSANIISPQVQAAVSPSAAESGDVVTPPDDVSTEDGVPIHSELKITAVNHIVSTGAENLVGLNTSTLSSSGDTNTSGLNSRWQCIRTQPETTPVTPPTTQNASAKSVRFSVPVVTEQRQFTVPKEALSRTCSKKLKKKHRHHSGGVEERSKVKRERTKEGCSVEGDERSKVKRQKTSVQEHSAVDFTVQTSSIKFSDVGGCEGPIQEICKLLLHFQHPEVFSWLGINPPQGFLLHGPPGCGKTLLANAIAGELNLPFIKLSSTEVVSGVSGESESTLRDLFTLTKSQAPCILFIDEIDAICRKRESAQREMERRIVTQLLSCLDDLNQTDSSSRVLVIGATSCPDTLDPALRRAGRFDREISLGIPDRPARESILKVLGQGLRLEEDFPYNSISRQTPGFVGADLVALVQEASLCAVNRVLSGSSVTGQTKTLVYPGPVMEEVVGDFVGRSKYPSLQLDQNLDEVFITTQDFMEALKVVQPSSKREGFATVPDITWDDVGALEYIREELCLAILAPVRYPDQFSSLGLTSPPGILLAGPPGCGKTLLAKAIANETGINFISVKGPELLNMYVGESEKAVRQVFQRARNSAPCVIFFDEVDALCPRRSDLAESSASSRVVNQLLTEMDGLVARKQVFIMGATNRPDIIDPAVLRPGRLDKVLYVGLPSAEDRAAILNTITKSGSKPKLGADVDLSLLASDQHSRGYTGADLTGMVREAAIAALREHMKMNSLDISVANCSSNDSGGGSGVDGECVVEMKHFLSAISKLRPSISEKDRVFYEQMAKRFSIQQIH